MFDSASPLPRRLVAAVALACAAAAGTPALAQSAVAGRALFEDTINTTGNNTLTGNCTSCHSSIQDRRTQIAGGPYAEISLTTAINRVGTAIANVATMKQFQALNANQIQDLAAYIADTPEVSTDQLNFSAAAVNTMTAAQFVDLRNSVAAPATETLRVVKVEITGAAAARFRRVSDTCDQATLAVGGSCRVTVDFTAPDTTGSIVPLVFTLRQGASATTFSRTVFLNGTVAVTSPPSGAASDGDSGGGALGWQWLAGLALGMASLLWTQRKVRQRKLVPIRRQR